MFYSSFLTLTYMKKDLCLKDLLGFAMRFGDVQLLMLWIWLGIQQIKETGGLKRLVAIITDQPPVEEETKGGKADKKAGSRAGKKSAKGEGQFPLCLSQCNASTLWQHLYIDTIVLFHHVRTHDWYEHHLKRPYYCDNPLWWVHENMLLL